MKTVRTFNICICVFLSLLVSCSKDEQPFTTNNTGPDRVYLYDHFKPFMFKAGSYWVYENDSTNILDSISVTSTQQDFYYLACARCSGWYIEFYKINIHDFLDTIDYSDYLSLDEIKRWPANFFSGQATLLFGWPIGSGKDGATVMDSIASLNVGSNNFSNVVKVKNRVFPYDTYCYFKDSIGIVKKEIDTTGTTLDSWSLKRWHVIL